jgi:hypothetical protein
MDMETNMTTNKIMIVDALTGDEEVRLMNAAELADYEVMLDELAKSKADATARAANKAAVLVKLGITADEAALLLS